MVQKILSYIKKNNLMQDNDKIIVGVSGGADSVCLLFVLMELKKQMSLEIVVVHVEHGVRDKAGKEDADFVKRICKEYNLPYRKYSYDVPDIAKRKKISVEEAGRDVRYQSFYHSLKECKAQKIAVAHNQNDNAETILLNLFRGSGMKGISGIPPRRNEIIRPLLCLEREEIESYLNIKKLSYRTDSTNFEDHYTRNKIRLHLLPYVKENINPKVVRHISEMACYVSETEEFLEKITDEAYKRCVKEKENQRVIEIEELVKEEIIIQTYIVRLCIKSMVHRLKDITGKHIKELLELKEKEVGKQVSLPYFLIGKRGYENIFIEYEKKKKMVLQDTINIKVPGNYIWGTNGLQIEFSLHKGQESEIILEKPYTKWFDYDKIISNLQLRTRKTGDYIQNHSSGGTKKLKDYFIDQKIPREERDEILLLADGSNILWIVGHRMSEGYKITENTRNILKVKVNGGKKDV